MGGNPNTKGVGVIGVVDALLSDRERFEPAVPEKLRHYLDEPCDPVGWYPSEDLVGLLDALMTVAPLSEMPRREAFELIGVISARRDVRSDQELVIKPRRSTLSGAYEGAINKDTDLPTTLRRILAIWQLYWEDGEQIAERLDERSLRICLLRCAPTIPEVCWLHTGFFTEAFQLAEVNAEVHKLKCTANGDPQCQWTVHLPDVDPALLASLPEAAKD